MKTVKITGMNYGFSPNGIVYFSYIRDGMEHPDKLVVYSQYGWEDGCQSKDWHLLEGNIRFEGGKASGGDIDAVASCYLSADSITPLTRVEAHQIINDWPGANKYA